jgi:hypothetical protein
MRHCFRSYFSCELCFIDDEALVAALRDEIDPVVCLHLEGELPSFELVSEQRGSKNQCANDEIDQDGCKIAACFAGLIHKT